MTEIPHTPEVEQFFNVMKPLCESVIVNPTLENVDSFTQEIKYHSPEMVQYFHRYLIYPFAVHVTHPQRVQTFEMQLKMVDTLRIILERVRVTFLDLSKSIESGLVNFIFDRTTNELKVGVPEELKLSVVSCSLALTLSMTKEVRLAMLDKEIALLAQVIYTSTLLAKGERLKQLRMKAVENVRAHCGVHEMYTDKDYHLLDPSLEDPTVELVTSILPGVTGALQDVVNCTHNPGYTLIVAALETIHRILGVVMNDKFLPEKKEYTTADFIKLVEESGKRKETDPKTEPRRTEKWYKMAGDKLQVVTKALMQVRSHEHPAVRRELAMYCSRIMRECSRTMQSSTPLAVELLIALSKDVSQEVSDVCTAALDSYFTNASLDVRISAMEELGHSFLATLADLPRALTRGDTRHKLTALNLVYGYVELLCAGEPQQLRSVLVSPDGMRCLCDALLDCCALHGDCTLFHCTTKRDVLSPSPVKSPWCRLQLLSEPECEARLRDVCQLLARSECAHLILDRLLHALHTYRANEALYVMNCFGSAKDASPSLAKRLVEAYMDEDIWYLPSEVRSAKAVSDEDALTFNDHNTFDWIEDHVPGLYEGATQVRYSGISYMRPRSPLARLPPACPPCPPWHMARACLVAAGLGQLALRLRHRFQPHLLRALGLVLERAGSKYEYLHLAGVKAINDIAAACDCASVADLISHNADYFTHQLTKRLKAEWEIESALHILIVVLEFSESSVQDCVYSIMENVLFQSCDKHYDKYLDVYMQLFLTYVECVRHWYPSDGPTQLPVAETGHCAADVLAETIEFAKAQAEAERLMATLDSKDGKSVEDMYKEDSEHREENALDYDDKITEETAELPQHIKVVISILKRCINYISISEKPNTTILILDVVEKALRTLQPYENDLLPVVHCVWRPLVATLEAKEAPVLRRALRLLLTMAALARDFLRSRAVTDVLPHIYKYLKEALCKSCLKDKGSLYRNSQEYALQVAALGALPGLALSLRLEHEQLERAMACVHPYLSSRQPTPLQELAVNFFKTVLEHDYAAVKLHLRAVCDNPVVMAPPVTSPLRLEPYVGTPYQPADSDFADNIHSVLPNDQHSF